MLSIYYTKRVKLLKKSLQILSMKMYNNKKLSKSEVERVMEKLKKPIDVVSTTSNKEFETKAKCTTHTKKASGKQKINYQLQLEIDEFEKICNISME